MGEEAKAKKEKERLAKLQKKKAEKLEKLKKEEEAKAKKEKDMAEKRLKQEKERIEKQKKEDEKQKKLKETKAKKEADKLAQIQKPGQEKIQTEDNSKVNELNELAEVKDYDENQIDNLNDDQIGADTKTDNDSDMKVKPTESVIKRGVPKNTKPAPAVVAVKMADLLSAPDDGVDQDLENNVTRDVGSPDHIGNECDDQKQRDVGKTKEGCET